MVQRLPKEILEKPDFESYFVGAESKIDQVLSSTWLKAHTKHWTWKNFIMANTPRCGACILATSTLSFQSLPAFHMHCCRYALSM